MDRHSEDRRTRGLSIAGGAAFLAAAQWILLVIVAETRYPGYSVAANFLSDLGATCHRGLAATPCVIVDTPSLIWNTTLSLLGLLSLVAAVFFYRATRRRAFTISFAIFGTGALVAGVVPETLLSVHETASLLSFLGGGVAAILATRFLKTPINLFSAVLGALALIATFVVAFQGPFFRWNGVFGLGLGGIERMVVYPLVIWEIGFGSAIAMVADRT